MTTSKQRVAEAKEALAKAQEEDQAGLELRKEIKKRIPIDRKKMEDAFVLEKQNVRAMNNIISVKATATKLEELEPLVDAHLKIADNYLNAMNQHIANLKALKAAGG